MGTTSPDGSTVPRSRREIREAEEALAGRTPRRTAPASRTRSRGVHAASPGHTWVTRVTVLGSLAAATIAAPLTATADSEARSPFDLESAPTGPSTLAVLRSGSTAPATSAAIAAAPRERSVAAASRASSEREPLPNCDGDASVDGGNGQLADHSLCALWQDGEQLQPDAAIALSALNEAFSARFGRNLCLVDSYRSLSSQYSVKASRGYLAATPGTSMHGWGLAIDLCSKETGSSEVYSWLWDNAPAYGWENPPWAQRGGSGKYEPWHWEYRPGVEQITTWH
ncbi:M15 family metallopeptidase [Isoptericola dokdonensis]|uniref:D-alanyl-D-alanine carboxypeptidase n=1 Tax=Isoptericola dokdonensis DS-3 TaxID=1300344 RepID=A0A161I1B0_9MICO|nr:M15 family metallopeptidase [Isoptericola dokdonensis]ANC32913.1 D-alanyl-D-alanine carboxypeptidase [Isoptericola dokdonensis DS-3]